MQTTATRQQMLALAAQGFDIREAWLDGYYDGLHAIKRVGTNTVEVFAGGADNGEPSDEHYLPVVYVNDRRVAVADSPERAARIADIRVRMFSAAARRVAA